jgi:hypothetical protein
MRAETSLHCSVCVYQSVIPAKAGFLTAEWLVIQLFSEYM